MDYPHTLIIDKNIDAAQVRLNRVIKQLETWFLKKKPYR